MSAYIPLSEGIEGLFDADTGSGGFNNALDPIVEAYGNLETVQGGQLPLISYQPLGSEDISGLEDDVVSITVQFDIYTKRAEGLGTMKTIADRLRTVFRRIEPTVTGWTAKSAGFTESQPALVEPDSYHAIFEIEYLMTKD